MTQVVEIIRKFKVGILNTACKAHTPVPNRSGRAHPVALAVMRNAGSVDARFRALWPRSNQAHFPKEH